MDGPACAAFWVMAATTSNKSLLAWSIRVAVAGPLAGASFLALDVKFVGEARIVPPAAAAKALLLGMVLMGVLGAQPWRLPTALLAGFGIGAVDQGLSGIGSSSGVATNGLLVLLAGLLWASAAGVGYLASSAISLVLSRWSPSQPKWSLRGCRRHQTGASVEVGRRRTQRCRRLRGHRLMYPSC